MTSLDKQNLIQLIQQREQLRPLSRVKRLLVAPLRTLPYYVLAAISHLKPFPLTFKTLWDTKMTCYLPEGNTFYYYGYCEANLTNFFLRYLKPGMTFFDVGAHVGFYSMLASELVGETGSVHSFEPTPHTFSLLTKNTKELPNVTSLNKAVSDNICTIAFADYGAGYSAYNTASKEGAQGISKSATNIAVQSVTLDGYCQSKDVYPSVIKIDAEGFEPHVLAGAKAVLTRGSQVRPLVTLEVAGGVEWADNRRESFTLLSSYIYEAFEVAQDGMISEHTLRDNYQYDNLLFIPVERVAEIKATLL